MENNDRSQILEAIQDLATQMDKKFEVVDENMRGIRHELADTKQELLSAINHVDKKVDRVAEKLLIKKVISEADAREIITLETAPRQNPA